MLKLLYAASLVALVAMSSSAIAQNKPTSALTNATQPLPAGSCIQISQWTGSAFVDRKLCSNYAFSFGAALSTRSIGTSGLLTGGGDLTADRTISIAPQAACTIVANATTGLAAPTAVGLGTGLACSGGQIIVTASGTGDVVGPASATDNMLAAFDGTTGKLIKTSGVLVSGLAAPGGTTGAIQYRNAGGAFAGVVISGLTKGNGTNPPSAAVLGTDFSLITPITCSGTDKLSAVTAAGAFTCTTDAVGGGLTLVGVTNGALLYNNNGVLAPVNLNTGLQLVGADLSLETPQRTESTGWYTFLPGDGGYNILLTNASSSGGTMPTASATAAGWSVYLDCNAPDGCTIQRAGTDTLNGATANISWPYRSSLLVISDGVSNYSVRYAPGKDPLDGRNIGYQRTALQATWIPKENPNEKVIYTATNNATVASVGITVAVSKATAGTIQLYKTGSGTACSGGTAVLTDTVDAAGTANTVQYKTVAGAGAGDLSSDQRLCLVSTGTGWDTEAASGGITVQLVQR